MDNFGKMCPYKPTLCQERAGCNGCCIYLTLVNSGYIRQFQKEIDNNEGLKATRSIQRIKYILEDYGVSTDTSFKIANKVYDEFHEDAEIADGIRDVWANQEAGSE